jgi:signal transduction histidine kinase
MRVYEMIADMMLFARPPRPERQTIELVSLVDAIIADLQPRCQQQETTLVRQGKGDPVSLQADPTQLSVVLRAICQNALEALGNGGSIQIDVEQDDSEVRIRIVDDGPGIKEEERRHLFDPFYSARQAGRGLGLGLSKAWRIVTNHGGRIDVESRSGHGSTFVLVFPKVH